MATPEAYLDAIAPQFPDDARRATFVELATERTGDSYGTRKDQAIAYLTAHLMTLADPTGLHSGGAVGPVNSKKEGDLSVGFGQAGGGSSSLNADLSQTHYGVTLAGIRKGSIMALGTTGET